MFYGFDWTYVVFILPCVIISLICQINVSSTFSKYSQMRNSRNMTGAQAAEFVLRQNGVYGVRIERVAGNLTDHFDPRTNVIRLSDSVYNATTVAAVGVACHEAGHAVQHAQNYLPNKISLGNSSYGKYRLKIKLVFNCYRTLLFGKNRIYYALYRYCFVWIFCTFYHCNFAC